MRVLSACLGLTLERTSLREVLLRQASCDPSCDPPTWCGVATTLCAGEEETSSLVEKLRSGFRLGDRERRILSVLGALDFACRHRLGGVVQDGDRKSLGVPWT